MFGFSLVEIGPPSKMDRAIEECVDLYRARLYELLLEEPQNFDDLHDLVEKLLELKDEFEVAIGIAEDFYNNVH